MTGSISSVDYSNGEDDLLIMGLTLFGKEVFVMNLGGSLNDESGGILYNPV